MVQVNLNKGFASAYKETFKIVDIYLESCWSCRNDDEHMRNHIHKKYPSLNSETLRRTRQKIQNTLGRHQADIETQAFRQAKEKWVQGNINKI